MAKVTTDAALDAFADGVPVRPVLCWVCNLKERAWVEKARRDGRTIRVICETLIKACGYPPAQVTKNKLSHHFQNHMETR